MPDDLGHDLPDDADSASRHAVQTEESRLGIRARPNGPRVGLDSAIKTSQE